MKASINMDEFSAAVQKVTKDLTVDQFRALTQKVGLEALTRTVLRTPVDTGRLRANWQVTIGAPSGSTTSRKDKSGRPTIAAGQKSIEGAPTYPLIFLVNNLPYAVTVEEGGFVPANPDDSPAGRKRRARGRTRRQREAARVELGHPGATRVRKGYSIKAPRGMLMVSLAELRQMFP